MVYLFLGFLGVFLGDSIYQADAICLAKKFESVPKHTACLSANPVNIMEKGVSDSDKRTIVDAHDRYRSREPAANMQKMVWDEELALIAQKWADNCDFNHDAGPARSIPGRFSAGQNLALGYHNWAAAIFGWYDEVKLFRFGSATNSISEVGHYTQVVWAETSKVGCGYTMCANLRSTSLNGKFYACNYGPAGNVGNYNIPYKRSTQKGQDCPEKFNKILNLCDCGGKTCENGGKLDLNTCLCKCRMPFHTPDRCKVNCAAAFDGPACGKQWPKSYCLRFSNVPYECPHMCQVCPYGGIDFKDSTVPLLTVAASTTRKVTNKAPNIPTKKPHGR